MALNLYRKEQTETTTARSSSRDGFFLDEKAARQVHLLIKDALERLNSKYSNSIHLELKDGTVTHIDQIDDFADLEHHGLRQITSVGFQGIINVDEKESTITIIFRDIKNDPFFANSILVEIDSPNRDWALTTLGDVDDRLSSIKRFSFYKFSGIRAMISAVTIATAALLIPVLVIMASVSKNNQEAIQQLENLSRIAELTTIEAFIAYERIKAELYNPNWILFFAAIPIFLLALSPSIRFLSNPYTFYIGDGIRRFDRRVTILKTIFGVIGAGFLVSLAAGLVLNYFTGAG
ncbi:hypothetical protein PUV54_08750 [Hyphococcus flavus]|uniref:Uncharacterized protein n=1 Tax=Hyphococcus flavus TaxID=1866326 RepID=A0AAE9ZAF0_9PROT|nr:hypothetical protein [Hyphococcus flavus]WDI30046.1 hypothetical protein PUV54_08750 [Hyphococcus flavus]